MKIQIPVTDDFLWYEENPGIGICVEAFEEVKVSNIRWIPIIAAMERKGRIGG